MPEKLELMSVEYGVFEHGGDWAPFVRIIDAIGTPMTLVPYEGTFANRKHAEDALDVVQFALENSYDPAERENDKSKQTKPIRKTRKKTTKSKKKTRKQGSSDSRKRRRVQKAKRQTKRS